MEQKRLGLEMARAQIMHGVPPMYDLGTPSGYGFELFGFKWITFALFAIYCYNWNNTHRDHPENELGNLETRRYVYD